MASGFALDGKKWDGMYLGRRKGDDLVYAGKVDHGFDKISTAELRRRLEPLVRKTQPYAKRIGHKGIWVEPSGSNQGTVDGERTGVVTSPGTNAAGTAG